MISSDKQQPAVTLPPFQKIIWLLPAAYFLHIFEEYVGGFPAWVTHDVHGSFDDTAFAANNVVFMLILLTLVYLNYRQSTPLRGVLLVVFASANLFWDALFHLFMTPILDRYSPGLVTAMLLYYPICIVVGTVITKDKILTPRQFVSALLGGLALFGFVVWY
ncbi:MAG: HXXEE domain-containing protein, partial [Mycobacterium sp.]